MLGHLNANTLHLSKILCLWYIMGRGPLYSYTLLFDLMGSRRWVRSLSHLYSSTLHLYMIVSLINSLCRCSLSTHTMHFWHILRHWWRSWLLSYLYISCLQQTWSIRNCGTFKEIFQYSTIPLTLQMLNLLLSLGFFWLLTAAFTTIDLLRIVRAFWFLGTYFLTAFFLRSFTFDNRWRFFAFRLALASVLSRLSGFLCCILIRCKLFRGASPPCDCPGRNWIFIFVFFNSRTLFLQNCCFRPWYLLLDEIPTVAPLNLLLWFLRAFLAILDSSALFRKRHPWCPTRFLVATLNSSALFLFGLWRSRQWWSFAYSNAFPAQRCLWFSTVFANKIILDSNAMFWDWRVWLLFF